MRKEITVFLFKLLFSKTYPERFSNLPRYEKEEYKELNRGSLISNIEKDKKYFSRSITIINMMRIISAAARKLSINKQLTFNETPDWRVSSSGTTCRLIHNLFFATDIPYSWRSIAISLSPKTFEHFVCFNDVEINKCSLYIDAVRLERVSFGKNSQHIPDFICD